MIESTIGRFIFNEIIPQDLGFVDRSIPENELKLEVDFHVAKKQLKQILEKVINVHGATQTAVTLDDIKAIGYKFSTRAAMTVSISDMTVPASKPKLIDVYKRQGLKEAFADISPIADFAGHLSLEFVDFTLCRDDIKYTIEECKERDATYAAPLKVKVRLYNKDKDEMNEHEIFMGDLPLMKMCIRDRVYESLDAMELKPEDHPDIDGMIEAINRQNIHEIAGKFGNVLELVTAGKYPVIGEIEQVMKAEGAVNAMMSGSGPTVFGLFTNPQAAQNAYERLRYGDAAQLAKQVYITNFFNVKRSTYII